MSVTNTDPTMGSLYGTPVLFFPVPTAWPSAAGCDKYIYRQLGEGIILAWDPVYTSFGTGIESCLLPQQRRWWFQATTESPSIALGPTFVCPEAYSAVHSTVLDTLSATQTQYTYCCPPNFALGAIPPPNQRTVIECTSTAGPGQTISYVSVTFLTSTATTTGANGTPTRQVNTRLTGLPNSTVVRLSGAAATVYAPPVNGCNLVREHAGESSTATTPPPSPSQKTSDAPTQQSSVVATPPPTRPSLAPGAIAGAVVGGLLSLGLLALGALFFVRRRYRTRHSADLANRKGRATGDESPTYGELQGLGVSEIPVDERAQELPHGLDMHELSAVK